MYNLGNSFYIVDRFLPEEHPTIADLDFATSWNMPENTDSVPGRPGYFEGTRSATPGGVVESRIQLCCKGFTGIAVQDTSYYLTKNMKDTPNHPGYRIKQISFENNSSIPSIITHLRIVDGNDNFKTITNDIYNATTDSLWWETDYADGSKSIIFYNTTNTLFTIGGITSNATLWIFDYFNSSSGRVRLFNHTAVSTTSHTITSNSGGQCDISL